MASSSSTDYSYDVFLSFRGTDTRHNFTSHLHKALLDNNVKAFIDNIDIDRGEEITPFLEGIIESVKLSIIVFSLNYASSSFCLDEMVKVIECKETKTQIVLPVFYKVYPSEEIYEEAFTRHEQTSKQETIVDRLRSFFWRAIHWATFCFAFDIHQEVISKDMKVERWRSSFQKALKLAGWHIDGNSDEAEAIGRITKIVLEKLSNSLPQGEELMITSMVGQRAEHTFKKVWECLMNDKISRVGMYGMGGVGKTTIATRVNDQLLASKSFSGVYWVTVSKDWGICNIQENIAKMMKLDLSQEDDKLKRSAKLRKRLESKKFVLILDDVWEDFEIKDVGIPPLVGGKKLLLTSRSRRVCEIMECRPIEVKLLSNDEALDLFVKESKYQKNDSVDWGFIVSSIVKECDGLPLAIVVIARRMRGVKEIRNWRNTLRKLQNPFEGENLGMEKKVFKVLKFSYDCLPSERYRQCFLYCSLFPEDYQFEREDLIEFWIDEGLTEELDSRQAELDNANEILDELIYSSLLERKLQMHDMIRDMAHYILKVGSQFQNLLESVVVPNETKLQSWSNSATKCSKLSTFVLCELFIKEIPCFFVNMQSLSVLCIINTYVRLIPPLTGLDNLRLLKICVNQSLQEIPEGIERLVKLKALELSYNTFLRGSFPNGVLEKLSHLQSLDLEGSRVEVEPEELISLQKIEILRVQFFSLHKLNCYVKSEHWRRLADYQIQYGVSDMTRQKNGLSFKAIRHDEEWKGESGILIPHNMQNLRLSYWERPMFHTLKNPTFVHLQTIRILYYKSRYLFTVELAQQMLHNVRELDIRHSPELEEIIVREEECVNTSNFISYPTIKLPNLKILSLFDLGRLRSIYRDKIVCSSLELTEICGCGELERLPFCMGKKVNKQNSTVELRASPVMRRWWESLQWDDPNNKSMYCTIFSNSSENHTDNESESD